jgi:hypothetical protein
MIYLRYNSNPVIDAPRRWWCPRFTFAKKVIVRATFAAPAALILAGCCRLTEDQEHLLGAARAINRYPVKRQVLLSRLGLEGLPSQRLDGSVRSRRMSFTESWEHGSGLTILAFDSEYAGGLAIVPGSIDEKLDAPGRKPADFFGTACIGPARKTFEGIMVSKGDEVLYRSTEGQREGAAAPNRSAAPFSKSESSVRGSEG